MEPEQLMHNFKIYPVNVELEFFKELTSFHPLC